MSYYPGYYGPREYYRGRRRRRSPFDDMNLASLGKLYSDVPVTAVQTAMEGLNTEYRRVADYKDNLEQALASAQVMEGDSIEKQNLIKNLRDQINTFAEDTGGAFEKGDSFVRGLARDVSSNPWLYKAIDNKQKFDQDQKMLDEMRVKGLAPLYFADPNFTTMGADGTPQSYESYIGSAVNRRPVLESFFNNIKADRRDVYDRMMNITSTISTVEGVQKAIDESFGILQGTKEYRQSLENEQARAQFEGRPFDQEAFDNQWKTQLAQVGQEFAYTETIENPNRALFNQLAMERRRKKEMQNNISLVQSVPGAPGQFLTATDSDSLSGDDKFQYYIDGSKYNETYKEGDVSPKAFNGNIIDLRTSGEHEDGIPYGPQEESIYTSQTGNIVQMPLIVSDENAYYKSIESEIQDAMNEKGIGTWSMNQQKSYANELPFTGDVSLFGERFSESSNLKPLTLTVPLSDGRSVTVNYLELNDQPYIVENKSMMQHSAFKADDSGEYTVPDGFVYAPVNARTAANYGVPTTYSTMYTDGSGQATSLGNVDNTLTYLQQYYNQTGDPMIPDIFKKVSAIKQKFNTNDGILDQMDHQFLRSLDTALMPTIIRTVDPDPVIERELSKRSTNVNR